MFLALQHISAAQGDNARIGQTKKHALDFMGGREEEDRPAEGKSQSPAMQKKGKLDLLCLSTTEAETLKDS